MNNKEAIQAMLDGKKVRDTKWINQHEYLYIQDGEIMCETGAKLKYFSISGTWEIYEEPKPKQTVTIEKWLCKCMFDGEYRIIETSNIKLIDSNYEKVKLLDTHEVKL